jgi:starvation-inducible DNA-binding protein
MHLSKNDIQTSVRILKELLANTHVLSVKTQNFHWNIEDVRFHMLHAFFSEQYTSLIEEIDEIAERIRMLGEYAPGSMAASLDLAILKETKPSHDGQEMLQQLTEDHHTIICILRKSIEHAAKTQDQGTLDFLISCLQQHEKMAWMAKSHLKA